MRIDCQGLRINVPGIDDELFLRGKVPMTKQDIRILTMVKAEIGPSSAVADIGAGTGSLSIEAALLSGSGQVYALERKPEAVELIKQNQQKFGVKNLTVINAEAPAGMEQLPELDAVLIGGSGRRLPEILEIAIDKLKQGGKIVLNFVTIQSLQQCLDFLHEHKAVLSYHMEQVQINRYRPVGGYDMAEAQNPIFIVTCTRL